MNKKFLTSLLFFSAMTSVCLAQLPQPYVRKTVKPNFFIPEGAVANSRPERVFIPQYRQGSDETTKHISRQESSDNYNAPVPQKRKLSPYASKQQIEETNDDTTSQASEDSSDTYEEFPSEQNDSTPEYQKMYQDYLKDLNNIANGKESKLKGNIEDDLSVMDSEDRIEIDKQFNKQRDVKSQINKALR